MQLPSLAAYNISGIVVRDKGIALRKIQRRIVVTVIVVLVSVTRFGERSFVASAVAGITQKTGAGFVFGDTDMHVFTG